MSRTSSFPSIRGGDLGGDGRPIRAHCMPARRVRQRKRVGTWFQDVGFSSVYVSHPSRYDSRRAELTFV